MHHLLTVFLTSKVRDGKDYTEIIWVDVQECIKCRILQHEISQERRYYFLSRVKESMRC